MTAFPACPVSCVRNLGELRPGTVEPPQHATPYRVLQRRPRAAAAASESHPLSSLGFELVDAFPRLVTVTADQPAISSSQVGQMSKDDFRLGAISAGGNFENLR